MASRKNKSPTEQAWMNEVAMLPCACCGDEGVELHHIREGQGLSQRAGHFLVIPLCYDCHRGPCGLHGDRTMFRIHKTDELKLLNQTISNVARGFF